MKLIGYDFPALQVTNMTCIMAVEIITREDLMAFKAELLSELKAILLNTSTEQKKWLRSKEVRKLLQISPGTLQNYRVNGTIRYSKFGNTFYYSLEEIDRLLEQSSRNIH